MHGEAEISFSKEENSVTDALTEKQGFRVWAGADGFSSLRTGNSNNAPDSDLVASVWNDDFLPLLANAPATLNALINLEAYLRLTAHHNAPEAAAARQAIRKATGATS